MPHAARPYQPDQGLRVLLVDDDPLQLELMTELLQQQGITSVQAARSGQAGLELYRQGAHAPDLIVVDLCMPQVDGMDFLQQLAHLRCASHVVIVSGHNHTPPPDPEWRLAQYDGPVLHLAEKLAHLQGLRVRGTFEKPLTRDTVRSLLDLIGYRQVVPAD